MDFHKKMCYNGKDRRAMNVHDKSVVKFEFTLKIDDKVIERTSEGKTKTILMGFEKGLPPGLESSLLGHKAGETFIVKIENGYGLPDKDKVQTVPRSSLPKTMKVEVGEQLYSQDEQGKPVSWRITAIDGDTITVDANHEHAGKTLVYEIKLHNVRDAEQGELEHGHVHGEGGVVHH
jgi:FKBP-type peptidyl-prolyl cis-trans isomerase SlyD